MIRNNEGRQAAEQRKYSRHMRTGVCIKPSVINQDSSVARIFEHDEFRQAN